MYSTVYSLKLHTQKKVQILLTSISFSLFNTLYTLFFPTVCEAKNSSTEQIMFWHLQYCNQSASYQITSDCVLVMLKEDQ